MAKYLVAHDLGTSGNKACLFSSGGELIASEVVSYPTQYSNRGWAEQNPLDWWHAVCIGTQKILQKTDPKDIAAVALAGHMQGFVGVDHGGIPLMNSIIWSDGRAVEESQELIQKLGAERINRISGQCASASYTLPKVMWVRRHHPELYQNLFRILQAKDYINYCLTGQMATEITDAAYTLAYDITRHCWSDEMLSAAEIHPDLFPTVLGCDDVVGTVTGRAARECGLAAGTPVVAGAGDGSAAHIGAGCVNDGDTYVSLGSSAWVMTQLDRLVFDSKGMTQTEPHVIRGKYVLGGTMQTGGLSYAWAHRQLCPKDLSYREIDRLADSSEPGAKGALFLPYLLGERSPWWDMDLNASFLGLRMETTRSDLLRAVLEGVAFNLKILLNVVEKYIPVHHAVIIGGGAKGKVWRQVLADVFDVPTLLPSNVEECTGIGAAIIAGVGSGVFPDYRVAREFLKVRETLEPRPQYREMYAQKQKLFEDAHDALLELNHRISRSPQG